MTRTTLAILAAETLATAGVAIWACTLSPVGTFIVGLLWAAVLLEASRWEPAT